MTTHTINRVTIHEGDCLQSLRAMPDESVHCVVTDPPYGLSFMGKKWDYDVPSVEVWQECLRVLKPGGHLLAFAGTRTQHRMAVRIEDAGFEIRDMIAWVYGSGFSKSMDVTKAIDKQRHDREQVLKATTWLCSAVKQSGKTHAEILSAFGFNKGSGTVGHWTATTHASQPAVPTLDQIPKLLDILGVCLDSVPDEIRELIWTLNANKGQPGAAWFERKVIGQKASGLSGGTGNTVGKFTDSRNANGLVDITAPATEAAKQWQGWGTSVRPALEPITWARKPLIGTVAENLLQHRTGAVNVEGCKVDGERLPANFIHDGSEQACDLLGAANRYFYCAKADASERRNSKHPTVKPLALMRYLCRLVCPPDGIVLDPFCGSGTTLEAARLEGFQAIGCELNPEYIQDCKERLKQGVLF